MESLGIEKNYLELFPNPSKNGIIHLNYYSLENTELNVSILDITGKNLLNKNIRVSEKMNRFQLDLSALIQGIYIVQFGDEQNSISRKLIIE